MLLIPVSVLFYSVSEVFSSCSWVSGHSNSHGDSINGCPTRDLCEECCRKDFKNVGTLRLPTGTCWCVLSGQEPFAFGLEYKMFCSVDTHLQQIRVGSIDEIRVVVRLADKTDDAKLEMFGIDDFDNPEISERFLIQEAETLSTNRPLSTITKSNRTKQYIFYSESKDLTVDRTAETFFFNYKMGDMGLTRNLWFTTVVTDSASVKLSLKPIEVQPPATEHSEMIVDTKSDMIGNEFLVWWNITTSEMPTTDITDVIIVSSSSVGLEFVDIVINEDSMSFTNESDLSCCTLLKLDRLPIDAFISFNTTYLANIKKVFVGESSMAILSILNYSHFDNGVQTSSEYEEMFVYNFTRSPSLSNVKRPLKTISSNVDCSLLVIPTELVVCYTGNVSYWSVEC